MLMHPAPQRFEEHVLIGRFEIAFGTLTSDSFTG
jgi:hypothetical protein